MKTRNVVISPLILSHYPKAILVLYEISEDGKDRDSYTTKLALGVSKQQPGRVFDRDFSTLPPPSPATVQDQRFGKIAQLWHNFLLNCDGGHMKARSCVILKRPRACWVSPLQMALCRAPTAAPTDGGSRGGERQKWSFSSQFLKVKAIPSTPFPARASVSSWHTASRVCLFYLGICMLCFWFDALPALSCVYSWGRGIWNTKIPQTKQSDGMRGTWKYESLTLSWPDLFVDHFHK